MKDKKLSKKLAAKQAGLMGLIQAMKSMDLEHIKGFKDKKKLKKPDLEATMESMGEMEEDGDED